MLMLINSLLSYFRLDLSALKLDVSLGGNAKVRQTEWRGQTRVDVREFESRGALQELRPTKKGVSLTLEEYLVLRDAMSDLNQALRDSVTDKTVDVKRHLGSNAYASVVYPYRGVSLRQFYAPKGKTDLEESDLRPGNGIFLKPKQFAELCKVDECIDDLIPELKNTERCMSTHRNQLAAIDCTNCNNLRRNLEYL